MLEGLLNEMLKDSEEVERLFQNYVIMVVPILNVEGVVIGNSKSDPQGLNYKDLWNWKQKVNFTFLSLFQGRPSISFQKSFTNH